MRNEPAIKQYANLVTVDIWNTLYIYEQALKRVKDYVDQRETEDENLSSDEIEKG